MIGLLDSGMGGENTLKELRKLSPLTDAVFLKDVKNAPYGTKTREELIRIVDSNVRTIAKMGAPRVLIACCTASAVWDGLSDDVRAISIPIIDKVTECAEKTARTGRIAVMATSGTVKSGAFAKRLGKLQGPQIDAQVLVGMIDRGLSDINVTSYERKLIRQLLLPLDGSGCDTLILGCTHFPSLERAILTEAKEFGIKYTVSSSRAGAEALLPFIDGRILEGGETVRI